MGKKSRRRRGPSPAEASSRHHQPSAGSRIPWVMVDRIAHRTKGDGDRVVRDEVADGTLSEISSTCTGKPIAVSLRVAEPPEVSRLYLHWPGGLRPEMSDMNRPTVIAAHGDSILFETYVPIDACGLSTTSYTAPSRPNRSPSLRRLPTHFKSGRVDAAMMNHYCKPYPSHDQRAMWRGDIGLLCRGDGGFTVANLAVGVQQPCLCLDEFAVLHHTPEETDMKWEVKQLPTPVPCDGHDGPPNLVIGGRSCSWETDY